VRGVDRRFLVRERGLVDAVAHGAITLRAATDLELVEVIVSTHSIVVCTISCSRSSVVAPGTSTRRQMRGSLSRTLTSSV